MASHPRTLTPGFPDAEAGTMRGWVVFTLGLALAACGEPADAPAHGLGLREALRSEPEAIEALPLEERTRLGLALREAEASQTASELVEAPADATSALLGFDAPREEAGEDAVVVLAVEPEGPAARVHTLEPMGPDGGVPDAPALELARLDPELDEGPYARALDGPAHEALQRMAAQTGATEIALGAPMPAGLLGDARTLTVNPSWLLLLAALDEHEEVGRGSSALIEPAEHHRDMSEGFGCYGRACVTRSSSCGPPTCECGVCGFDCGECATECGPESDGVHCSAARATPPPRSPLDPLWLVAPAAYLLVRRRR